MSRFSCEKCNRNFTTKQSLIYHCDNNACKITTYACKYCDKSYTTATSMYRHMRTSCDVKKAEETKRDEIYERLLKLEEENKKFALENKKYALEIKELKTNTSRMEKAIKNSNISNNNCVQVTNGNININNGTINHFTLIAHGHEDISKIDRTDLLKVFGSGFNSPLQLTETMHFNPKYPEFHNIYISSMKNKYAMMYDGTEWTLVMKDDLIDKLYDNKRDYIEENLDEFLDSLTNSQQKALHRWMNAGDSHPYIQKIKNDIKLLMYNKRKMALDNRYQSIDSDGCFEVSNINNYESMKEGYILNIMDNKSSEQSKQNICKTNAINGMRISSTSHRPGTKRKVTKRIKDI